MSLSNQALRDNMSKPKDVLTSYLIFICYYHYCDQSSRSLFLVCISFIVEACVYMGFSIIAVALGGIITIVYSVKIFFITSYGFQNNDNYRAKLAIIVIMLILDTVTYWIGI